MTRQDIIRIIEENQDNYDVFGLRVTESPLTVGSELENSFEYYDDQPVLVDGEHQELDGACAVFIAENVWEDGFCAQEEKSLDTALNMLRQYIGDNVALIAGNSYSYGQDPQEAIIPDATVLASGLKSDLADL